MYDKIVLLDLKLYTEATQGYAEAEVKFSIVFFFFFFFFFFFYRILDLNLNLGWYAQRKHN